jgi:hypothetical protein
MSWELDALKIKLNELEFRKADIYKCNEIENALYGTKRKLEQFLNNFSLLEERIAKLEQKERE